MNCVDNLKEAIKSTHAEVFKESYTNPWKIRSDLSHVLHLFYLKNIGKMSMINEPQHDKTNKMICAPSDDSDQPGHPPILIRVFAVRSMGRLGPKVSSCGQRRL